MDDKEMLKDCINTFKSTVSFYGYTKNHELKDNCKTILEDIAKVVCLLIGIPVLDKRRKQVFQLLIDYGKGKISGKDFSIKFKELKNVW